MNNNPPAAQPKPPQPTMGLSITSTGTNQKAVPNTAAGSSQSQPVGGSGDRHTHQIKLCDYPCSSPDSSSRVKEEPKSPPLNFGASQMSASGGGVVPQPSSAILNGKRIKEEIDDHHGLSIKKQKIGSGTNKSSTPVLVQSRESSSNQLSFISTPPEPTLTQQQQNIEIPSTSSAAALAAKKQKNKNARKAKKDRKAVLIKALKDVCTKNFGPKECPGKYTILNYNCMFPYCLKTFSSLKLATKHRIDVHRDKELYCFFLCGQSYAQLSELVSHIHGIHREEAKKEQLQCFSCDHEAKGVRGLAEHVYSVHQSCTFKCVRPKCHFMSKFASEMEVHWKQFHGETVASDSSKVIGPLFRCSVCDALLPTKKSLKEHRNKQHSNLANRCYACNQTCKSATKLDHHLRNVHRNWLRWECTKCSIATSSHRLLVEHYESDHLAKPFWICTFPNCQFEGVSSDEVVQHYTIHGGPQAVMANSQRVNELRPAPSTSHFGPQRPASSGFSCRIGSFAFTEKNHDEICIRHLGNQPIDCVFEPDNPGVRIKARPIYN